MSSAELHRAEFVVLHVLKCSFVVCGLYSLITIRISKLLRICSFCSRMARSKFVLFSCYLCWWHLMFFHQNHWNASSFEPVIDPNEQIIPDTNAFVSGIIFVQRFSFSAKIKNLKSCFETTDRFWRCLQWVLHWEVFVLQLRQFCCIASSS